MKPIKNKSQMYALLNRGALGNTIPLFRTVGEWQRSTDYGQYPQWGVRVDLPGDKRMRLYIPREEVADYIRANFPEGGGFNISPMIDQWAVLKGEVFEQSYEPFGLCLYAATGSGSWREQLRERGRHYFGLQAQLVLQHYCDPASYEDIRELLDLYPGHVIEFSACDRPVGKIPGRNVVIWEARSY